MNTFNNCVIFSPERLNDNLGTRACRIETTRSILHDIRASYKKVTGVYTYKDGTKREETSFLVDYDQHRNSDMLKTIKSFAFNQFDQESVLHLDSNRGATLIHKDGKEEFLGKFVSCSEEVAKNADAYTFSDGVYYIVKK